jgi:hypothetical protein
MIKMVQRDFWKGKTRNVKRTQSCEQSLLALQLMNALRYIKKREQIGEGGFELQP